MEAVAGDELGEDADDAVHVHVDPGEEEFPVADHLQWAVIGVAGPVTMTLQPVPVCGSIRSASWTTTSVTAVSCRSTDPVWPPKP
ncbi:hypothetical protein [Streptomyces sp. enrichment culture]|uniref:hypothetical protein n=1 Tax=Streptomyces sp. enrichment culture TaxID=1795815 RepID=UPI003F55A5E9